MPGDKSLLSIGVEYLGVPGVFGVPGVVSLGFTGKVDLWVTGKVVFLVPYGSMFTILWPYLLRPKL